MNQLPNYSNLEIGKLSSIFGNTTNSYKFYWFLAILDSVKENDKALIPMNELALRMVASVWYPLDYYKLSFGKQDSFKEIANYVSSLYKVDNSINSKNLFEQINTNLEEKSIKSIQQKVTSTLLRYVPYRFVQPFFTNETKGLEDGKVNNAIKEASNNFFSSEKERVIYRFTNDYIEINDVWLEYFKTHQSILRGFIYWHLVRFLQKNNENVVGLTEKLEKPTQRNLTLANDYWKGYLKANPATFCIYSDEIITNQNLSLDHFIPWSYVSHDRLWNIIPTPKNVNSSKNDKLPSIDLYFDKFVDLQHQSFLYYVENERFKLLEDYSLLFRKELKEIVNLPKLDFKAELQNQILPQIQTAKNMGFDYPFIYVSKK
jgi:hypothetical protein